MTVPALTGTSVPHLSTTFVGRKIEMPGVTDGAMQGMAGVNLSVMAARIPIALGSVRESAAL
jgi:hypothetical protein